MGVLRETPRGTFLIRLRRMVGGDATAGVDADLP